MNSYQYDSLPVPDYKHRSLLLSTEAPDPAEPNETFQNPSTKEYTLNHTRDPTIIYGSFPQLSDTGRSALDLRAQVVLIYGFWYPKMDPKSYSRVYGFRYPKWAQIPIVGFMAFVIQSGPKVPVRGSAWTLKREGMYWCAVHRAARVRGILCRGSGSLRAWGLGV